MIKDKNGAIIDKNNSIMGEKGIYKFYVKINDLETMLNNLKIKDLNIDEKIEKCEFDSNFYCVYVGQTKANGEKYTGFTSRVYNSHIKGSGKSTLRKSLKVALKLDDSGIKHFFKNENNYLFVLFNEPKEDLIDYEELDAINGKGFKILNVSENKYYLEKDEYIKVLLKFKELRKNV